MIGISYPGVSGKATAFTYDGLGRRIAISSTPAGGGGVTTTSYLWCGSGICQARDASDMPTRGYYQEGEFVPVTPGQPYYYGVDQIGSVRRAFASTTSAPAYSYDPYGSPLQATAPVTDFVYGGMFYNADSGLYLTKYRAYDPAAGRWLSRDPLGERTDPEANLYVYAKGNPVNLVDPSGRAAGTLFLPLPPAPENNDGVSSQTSRCDSGSPVVPTAGKPRKGGRGPRCVNCNTPHGGTYGPYCPNCYVKSLDPNGQVPPLILPLDPDTTDDKE